MDDENTPTTMLDPYYRICESVEIFTSREALENFEYLTWRQGWRNDLFAACMIANELAHIFNTDNALNAIAERYCQWWNDVGEHKRAPMRRVFIRLPRELVCAMDEFCERVESYYRMSRDTHAGFLLALAAWSNY